MVGGHVWKGRVRITPSGKTSVVCSLVPNPGACRPSPLVSRAKVRQSIIPDFWDERLAINEDLSVLPPGKGSLGNKQKASWKTCNNAYERLAAIEKEYGKRGCLFITLTQPSTDKRAFEALARWSSYAVDRLNRSIKRMMGDSDHCRVSVWEYQKRGSLHMHMVIGSDWVRKCSVSAVQKVLSKKWYSILEDISKRFESIPFLGSNGVQRSYGDLMDIHGGEHFCNVQRVKLSVCAYLAKYMAESNHEQKQKLREENFPVATWIQWNRQATAMYEKYMEDFDLGYAAIDHRHQIESAITTSLCEVKCKEGTGVVPPKNPYNFGGYYIGDKNQELHNARVIVSCLERISRFFKSEEDFKTRQSSYCGNVTVPVEKPMSLSLELLQRRIDRELRIQARGHKGWLTYLEGTVIMLIVNLVKLGSTPERQMQQLKLNLNTS